LTFADTATFYEIMDILDKRLNDKGKNWRHVLKSLKVLDYCLHEGSELVVTWARKNIYIIKTLREFQHIDDDGRDVGQNIRVSAKELTALILDEERLRAERRDRKSWKSRVSGIDDHDQEPTKPRRRETNRPKNEDEDLEYRLAIEASKNEAEEEAKRRAGKAPKEDDDDDLAKAIKLSKEEEELRRRELEEANANSLFDDGPGVQPAVAQPTGWNQGYQQQPTVDWFGNVIDPQQPQTTGYPVQNTGYQNGYGYQPTGQQPFSNNNFMQPQQTAFNVNSNPYGQQQQPNGFGAFGQQPQQQQSQEQPLQSGSNNPWGSNAGLQAEAQRPMPTGSNNPFASGIHRPQSAQPFGNKPTLSTLSEQKAATSFNPILGYSNPNPQPQPLQQPTQQPTQISPSPFQSHEPQKPLDPHHARLNALLSSGEGLDTFGNVGDLRIPAQHTAPGTFVNSAGQGLSKVTGQATGNPFLSNQFTGMPQTRMPPAQTGPAAGFGAYGNNPFGAPQGNPQQQNNGNLIDL
jgi:epsin